MYVCLHMQTDQLIAEGGYSCSSKTLVNKEINNTGVVLQNKSNESPQVIVHIHICHFCRFITGKNMHTRTPPMYIVLI